jgi:hypothetical protein
MFGNRENLHHAYLIEGERETVFLKVLDYLEKELGFSLNNNPDFWHNEFDTFGIEEGRRINDLQSKKSFLSGKKIFVIKTNFITREAQNSLLKMFEEPTSNTHFFIIMPSGEVLLPTLKSRLMILKSGESDSPQSDFVDGFLKSNLSERLEMIKVFFGDSKKKIPADKNGAINFLNQLEYVLKKKSDMTKINKKDVFVFNEIIKSRNFLNDRSPSVKMLLEHIAIII